MELIDDRLVLHVTGIGSCVRKEMLELNGEPYTDVHFYSVLGTFIHKMMEVALDGLIKNGELIDINSAHEEADRLMVEDGEMEGFGEQWHSEIMEKAERGWIWLQNEMDEGRLDPQRNAFIEVEMSIDSGVEIDGTPIWIVGRPDLVLVNGSEGTVIDFKSGKTRSKKHAWQVSTYAQLFGTFHKDVAITGGRVVYLGIEPKVKIQKNGKIHRYHEKYLDSEQIGKYFAQWQMEAQEYVENIADTYPDVPEVEDTCSACFFCPYRSLDWGPDEFGGA